MRVHVCYMLSSIRLLSVCLFVGNARAPYSGNWNFPQYLYGIWYFGHPQKILWRSSQGNLSIGGVKHKRGSQI